MRFRTSWAVGASRIAFYLLVADMWHTAFQAQGTPSLYYCPDPDHHIADQSEFLKGSERLDIFELSSSENIYRRSWIARFLYCEQTQ
jgi:hypothetical protein